jgi:hypothetical protein
MQIKNEEKTDIRSVSFLLFLLLLLFHNVHVKRLTH